MKSKIMEERAKVFEGFLTAHSYYIDYNGIHYTLIDNMNNIVIITDTSDELYSYILGYNKATESSNSIVFESNKKIEILQDAYEKELDLLAKQNDTNIERYEKIIKNLEDKLTEY